MRRIRNISILLASVTLFVLILIGLTKFEPFLKWSERFDKSNATYDAEVNLEDKPTLRVLYPNSGMSNAEFSGGWTTSYFEKLTGYEVIYEQTLGDQDTRLNTILAAGEEYHMFKLESGTFLKNYSNGAFVDLKPALDLYGKDLYEIIPQAAWDAVTDPKTGGIYAIPEVGFSGMMGHALVWNLEQLEAVGITKIPETMSEVTDAFYKLQARFNNSDNLTYHAFTMASAQAYVSTIAAAFELPENFFVDENNTIKHTLYHPQYLPYTKYMNQLVKDNILSPAWKGYTGSDIITQFALGNLGCAFINYWSLNDITSKMAQSRGITQEEAQKLIGWSLYVKGDGSYGTIVQEEPKYLSYSTIGYYCCIPNHMAEYSPYVIDWINKRIKREAFEGYRLGDEGVHFEYVDPSDPEAIEVIISGETKYVKTLPAYETDILPTSMYQCGVNPEVGINLWILSEKTYNCWSVLIDNDSPNALGNAIAMAPYIEGWSKIDIEARSWVLTREQSLLNETSEDKFMQIYNFLTKNWKTKYWTDEVDANVQAWHQSKSKK